MQPVRERAKAITTTDLSLCARLRRLCIDLSTTHRNTPNGGERADTQQAERAGFGDGGGPDGRRQTRQRQTRADGPYQRGGARRQVDREQLRDRTVRLC